MSALAPRGRTPHRPLIGVRATSALDSRRETLRDELGRRFDDHTAAVLLTRIERRWDDAFEALHELYGHRTDAADLLDRLLTSVLDAAAARSPALRLLDHRREADPAWFQAPSMVGYVTYVDRFAGTLAGVSDHLDHLEELGVTYLHLMSVIEPRQGDSDGGYAVVDYRAVDPRLGTIDDLESLAGDLRTRGISLCIDVVCNHTAREHDWAVRARDGDERYRAYYRIFPDRTLPDRYERTLPEVFPTMSPGNFTFEPELDAWVWTTFREFQWDLDTANPDVFAEMLDTMLFLANRGVEILRLDAVPFLWKRMGTNCQNLPEAHRLVQAWRALLAIAAPATICKTEAIVPPRELVQYLGAGSPRRVEAELAYHNQLMVMGWSGVASRDATLLTEALGAMATPPDGTAWCTYVRIHDDIGWAVDDADAIAVGTDPRGHRSFLASFYRGDHEGSFARGESFSSNPTTADERTCGMTSALAGLEQAIESEQPHLVDQAISRIRLLYGLALGWGGIPLIWMGDEIALGNDYGFRNDPDLAKDSRWLHRPAMDWPRAIAAVADPTSPAGRVRADLLALIAVRRATPQLRSGGSTTTHSTTDRSVFAWVHRHPDELPLLGLANLHDDPQSVSADVLAELGYGAVIDLLAPEDPVIRGDGRIHLGRLGLRWVTAYR